MSDKIKDKIRKVSKSLHQQHIPHIIFSIVDCEWSVVGNIHKGENANKVLNYIKKAINEKGVNSDENN